MSFRLTKTVTLNVFWTVLEYNCLYIGKQKKIFPQTRLLALIFQRQSSEWLWKSSPDFLLVNSRWSSRSQMGRVTYCCHGFRYPGNTTLDANWWKGKESCVEVVASSGFFCFFFGFYICISIFSLKCKKDHLHLLQKTSEISEGTLIKETYVLTTKPKRVKIRFQINNKSPYKVVLCTV